MSVKSCFCHGSGALPGPLGSDDAATSHGDTLDGVRNTSDRNVFDCQLKMLAVCKETGKDEGKKNRCKAFARTASCSAPRAQTPRESL